MDSERFIDVVAAEGRSFIESARRAGAESRVPTCPTWRVTDLVRHLAFVHRWAREYVEHRVAEFQGAIPEADVLATGPEGDELWPFYLDALDGLVHTLRTASDDLSCWSVLPGPTARATWSRRQAHETAIHRADAERAASQAVRSVSRDFAVDGIDELLLGFHGRPLSEEVRRARIIVSATDADVQWSVDVGDRRAHGARGGSSGDVVVSGVSSDLYFLLWNRFSFDDIEVTGDTSLMHWWKDNQTVTW